jgi:hypothetical protein
MAHHRVKRCRSHLAVLPASRATGGIIGFSALQRILLQNGLHARSQRHSNEAPRYLIRDRDRVYGVVVAHRLRAMGIRDRPIALGSPWQNGFAERLIGSIRRECVDHIVVLGEAHLRRILGEYAAYYNESRTHRSLDKDAPVSRPVQRIGSIRTMRSSAASIIVTSESRFLVHTRPGQSRVIHTSSARSRLRHTSRVWRTLRDPSAGCPLYAGYASPAGPLPSAAWAAARRAMGTRNGEHET